MFNLTDIETLLSYCYHPTASWRTKAIEFIIINTSHILSRTTAVENEITAYDVSFVSCDEIFEYFS